MGLRGRGAARKHSLDTMTDTRDDTKATAVAIPEDEQLRRYRAETAMTEAEARLVKMKAEKAEAEASLVHLLVYEKLMAKADSATDEDDSAMFAGSATNYFLAHFNPGYA